MKKLGIAFSIAIFIILVVMVERISLWVAVCILLVGVRVSLLFLDNKN